MAKINTLSKRLQKVTLIHFMFVGLLIAQIIIYDASKLIPPEIVLKRWIMMAILLVCTAIIWYLAKNKSTSLNQDRALVFLLVTIDIVLVSYLVYISRGMASRGVALYAIPILVSAILLKKSAVYFTTVLCIASYTTAAISYFVLNFNEGYKIELYGEVGFYSIAMLLVAGLITVFLPTKET